MDIRKVLDSDTFQKIAKEEREMLLKKIDKLLRLNHRQKLMIGILIISGGEFVVLSYLDYGFDSRVGISGILLLFAVLMFFSVVYMDIRLIHIKKHLFTLEMPEDESIETENKD